MSRGYLQHRRKAFRTSEFTVAADSEAGNYHIASLVNTTSWMGSSTPAKVTAWDTEDHRDSTTFTAESSGNFDVKTTGLYLIIVTGVLDRLGGANRSAARLIVYVNGSPQPISLSCFIRRASGHDSDETQAYAILRLTAGDDVQVYSTEINSGGSDAYWTGSANSYTSMNSSVFILRLNKNLPYVMLTNTGTGNDHQLDTNDEDIDQNWNSQTEIDTAHFSHSTTVNPDEIIINNPGRYLVCYSQWWDRNEDTAVRLGIYERLQLDGSLVHGSYSNNYIRGSQSGESILHGANSAITLFETTTANQKLKLTSAREAGTTETLDRHSTESSIMMIRLHDNVESFSIGSASTERLGDTTAKIPDFSSADWIDLNYSLASDQVTVTGAKDMLFGGGAHCDGAAAARVAPRWTTRVNNVESLLFAGAGYIRSAADMYKASPHVAGIGSPADGQTIGLYDVSTAADHSATIHRIANSGRFWGLDIDTL